LSRTKEIKKWILNEFCQGKTMRWCLAWTFKVIAIEIFYYLSDQNLVFQDVIH
jgi:hypothetical protein